MTLFSVLWTLCLFSPALVAFVNLVLTANEQFGFGPPYVHKNRLDSDVLFGDDLIIRD